MPLEEINRCIEEYERYNFVFSDSFLEEVRSGCKSWKHDWVTSFRKQLRRIKNGEGIPAHDKEDGNRVTTPLVMNRYMAIYFRAQTNGSYFVYDFELGNKSTI